MQYHYKKPVPCRITGFMDRTVQGLIMGSTLTDRMNATVYHVTFIFLLGTQNLDNSKYGVYVLNKGSWYNTYDGSTMEVTV